ncbi:Rhodanese-related sulfurtransferase [Andreprevotia lacus DSM 23236]|jgi:rhodanese-related sulfurtransferase|uniref:Rhodanese-related sulfurtransferase n=1 Tax=Andreprevotia lacus DSM 23236 TaxID=1121001 RepID=A0A1W1XRH3_9NEIS|nr:rhodanese-like domain-containing protein [Andreprevotia lacus]SMC26452.1 Rhodanese-related sulfurtransferase [Andreprevotia lacus DSM 23236]
MQQLNPNDLAAWLADDSRAKPVLLDVRESWEIAQCQLPGITHIPMNEIPVRQQELDPDAPTVVICHHGMRSYQVAMFLERNNGFAQLFNLAGGVAAWADQVDPAFPRY